MTLPLDGRTVALAEGRQLEELASMLAKEGAVPLRFPMLSILDAPDDAPLLDWLDRLQVGQFQWVIFLTGEGVRRLLACADRHGRRDAVIASLAKTQILIRGPKPAKALKEHGLAAALIAQSPTTDGVIATLRTLAIQGLTIGVQLYNDNNPPLEQFLRESGATAHDVQPYIYAPASDAARVLTLVDQLAEGKVDAIVFTSSPQIDRIFEVAKDADRTSQLLAGFARTTVAAVGPLVKDGLEKHGVTVQVCPEHGFVMKNLVQQLKRAMTA